MSHRAHVSNLRFDATETDVRAFFAGLVIERVDFINDRETGRPRGFGFVDFASAADLRTAIGQSGMDCGGRAIKVAEAHERQGAAKGGKRGGGKGGRRERDDDYSKSWK